MKTLIFQESEIVEVLWKQDVDLGYTLSPPILPSNDSIPSEKSYSSNDDVEKLKALEELKRDKLKDEEENVDDIDDEWAGIPFTIDNETGEYIRLPLDELLNDVLQLAELAAEDNESNNNNDDSIASTSQAANNKAKFQSSSSSSGANGYGSEENRSDTIASGTTTTTTTTASASGEPFLSTEDDLPQSEIEVSSLPSPLFDLDDEAKEELADLDIMIQSAAPPFHHRSVQNYAVGGANSAFRQSTGFHHHHPHSHHHHHQGRVPTLSRGVSMEQRLQDIASLFNPIPSMGVGVGVVGDMPPYPHYPTHYPYQGGAAIPPPQHSQFPHTHSHHHMLHNTSLGDICAAQPHYGHNLGSAVSSSMHLTNSSHDSDGASGNSAYKMEHDMMYYSNASSDLNHTTDGFINSILNDEDLHLMDMNVNDSFCSMRMVDVNSTSNNSSALGSTSGLSSGVGASGGLLPISMSSSNSMHGVGVGAGISGPTTTAATTVGGASGGGMTSDMINVVSGADRLDASSDSAVSSMGSERVPSLSDGEWGDGSDSAQDYHQGKYGGPYDYSYNPRLHDGGVGSRQPPVAQKKHQMFGKRYLQEHPAATVANGMHPSIKYEYEPYATAPSAESAAAAGSLHQGQEAIGLNADGAVGPQPQLLHKEHQDSMSVLMPDIKYGGYSLDFSLRPPRTPHEIINHNHTYTLPQGMGSNPRPQHRDKKAKRNSEDEHLTRDEKRARALNVPITVGDIINLPMDEFNERLSKYDLTENQLSLIRDIRRRGKNKVAAQNCRKRKLDQILSLEDEVKEVRRRKDHLLHERDVLSVERKRIANKFATLHRHIFQYLRDSEGNPCSASEYSLQQAADGSIYLLPRDSCKSDAAARATGLNTSSNGNSSSNQQQAPPHHNNNPHHHHPHPQQHPHHHHQQQHQTASAQHPHQQGPSTSTSSHHHHHNQQHHTHPHQQQQTQLQQHQSHPHPHQKD